MSDKNKSTTETADDSDRSPQVGALLRASRLRVGEDLREVSDNLCIRFLYLEAIEECRYEDLPGDTYAIGFIRSYAEHLGLDGEEVIRRYRLEKASSKRLSDLSFPTPVPESGVPRGAIVLVGVVLAVLVYGGWYATTTDDSILSDFISPVPERLQHLVGDGDTKPTEATPESTKENSDASAQNAAGVNTETQEALQANTAEAIAEATEAARDSIENTSAAVTEVMTETASPTAEAATSEVVPTTEEVIQSDSDTTEAAMSQVSETANEVSNVVNTASDTMTGAADGIATDVASTDTVVEPEPASETQPAEVTTPNEATSEPQVATEPEQASASSVPTDVTTEETASATTETTEPTVEESSPASAPVIEQVSAEDLNAQSLQAAAGEATPEPQTEQPTASVSEQTTAAPEVASTTPEAIVQSSGIVVRAIDNSWVQIVDPANDEILFTGLMAPGATFDVPARNGLLLDTGNAGAIDIIVNGNAVPKLGGEGIVRKGVALDGARLIAGTAAN